jgi:hypothetical protein
LQLARRVLRRRRQRTHHGLNDGWSTSNPTERGGHIFDGTYINDTKLLEAQERREEEKDGIGKRGTEEVPLQGGGHEGEGQRKGTTKTTMLWMEQWKWTLCLLITGAKLCIEDARSPPMHSMWKPRAPFTVLPTKERRCMIGPSEASFRQPRRWRTSSIEEGKIFEKH